MSFGRLSPLWVWNHTGCLYNGFDSLESQIRKDFEDAGFRFILDEPTSSGRLPGSDNFCCIPDTEIQDSITWPPNGFYGDCEPKLKRIPPGCREVKQHESPASTIRSRTSIILDWFKDRVGITVPVAEVIQQFEYKEQYIREVLATLKKRGLLVSPRRAHICMPLLRKANRLT